MKVYYKNSAETLPDHDPVKFELFPVSGIYEADETETVFRLNTDKGMWAVSKGQCTMVPDHVELT